jgi:hypothetical protein
MTLKRADLRAYAIGYGHRVIDLYPEYRLLWDLSGRAAQLEQFSRASYNLTRVISAV